MILVGSGSTKRSANPHKRAIFATLTARERLRRSCLVMAGPRPSLPGIGGLILRGALAAGSNLHAE
jgi:hypothetical protein